jgi:hypothetical protein
MKVLTTITSKQISSYEEKGYLSLASAFTPDEVKVWDAESKRLLRLGLAHEDNLRTVRTGRGSDRVNFGWRLRERKSPNHDSLCRG